MARHLFCIERNQAWKPGDPAMRKFVLCVVAALTIAVAANRPSPAQGVTLQTGDFSVFNFDFTSQPTPPPYANLSVAFSLENIDFGIDFAVFDLFGGLDATGPVIYSSGTGLPVSIFTVIGLSNPGLVDGLFSARVTATGGPFDVTTVTGRATIVDEANSTPDVTLFKLAATLEGTLVTSIPEPASLALLGGAVLAAAAFRRRVRR